jgi:hypothetical protein
MATECGAGGSGFTGITCELPPGHDGWHSTLNPERWNAIRCVQWPPKPNATAEAMATLARGGFTFEIIEEK